MAQHHLLASKSKNIALKDIFRLTESEAFHLLKAKRWGNPDNIRDVYCLRHSLPCLFSRISQTLVLQALPTSFLHYHQHHFLFSQTPVGRYSCRYFTDGK